MRIRDSHRLVAHARRNPNRIRASHGYAASLIKDRALRREIKVHVCGCTPYVEVRGFFERFLTAKPILSACHTQRLGEGSLTLVDCATCSGKLHDEAQHFRPEGRHCQLLSGYLLNAHRGPAEVHAMILRDVQGMQELGAYKHALDLKIVLECFLDCEA